MPDIYLYDDVPVLKNRLGIKDSNLLDAAEAGMSRANMMLLYESGFLSLQQDCARFTAAFLARFMSGQENSARST